MWLEVVVVVSGRYCAFHLGMTAAGGPTPVGGTVDGAASSWEMLLAEVRPAIISFARSRGITDPEDVAQDVFADVVERLPTFSGSAAELRSFVFTVAHRRIADRQRRLYRHAAHQMRSPAAVALPEDWVVDRDEVSWALRALADLDERSQRVLVLRFIEERGHAEIAQLLGVRETTARAIQSRALKRLRKTLERSRRGTGRRAMSLLAPLVGWFERGHGQEGIGPLGEWTAELRAVFGRIDATSVPPVGHAASGVPAMPTLSASASTATAAATAASSAPLLNVITAAVIAAASTMSGTATVMSTEAPHLEPQAASTAWATTQDTAAPTSEPLADDRNAAADGGEVPTIGTPTSVDVTTAVAVATTAVDVVPSIDGEAPTPTHDVPPDTSGVVDAAIGTVTAGPGPTIETGVATAVETPAQVLGDSPSADATVPISPVGAPAAPELIIESGAVSGADAAAAADAAAVATAAVVPVPPVVAPAAPEIGIESGADLADAPTAATAADDGVVAAAVGVAACGETVIVAACP